MHSTMVLACGLLLLAPLVGAAQRPIHGFIDPMPTAKLKQLFPRAASFAPRVDDPLHFKAYAVASPAASDRPIGYAFWTMDIAPEILGYHGHIHMLIGMDTAGTLTGVIMDLNTEPYGDISVNRPEFAAQFKGKSIRDPFIVGRDVDAMSRATITVRAAALTIRETARTVAKAVLTPESVPR
jgi:transcriptional regulator of nitric oxide reductase